MSAVRSDGSTVGVIIDAAVEESWLQMSVDDGERERFAGSNIFVALFDARLHLESQCLLLCCQGARPDVFPSGLLQQTTNGRFAYELHPGRAIDVTRVVDVFTHAAPAEVDTVERQKRFVFNFFKLPNRSTFS